MFLTSDWEIVLHLRVLAPFQGLSFRWFTHYPIHSAAWGLDRQFVGFLSENKVDGAAEAAAEFVKKHPEYKSTHEAIVSGTYNELFYW